MVFVCFCVRDTAATRAQYLALSKAWRSSYWCNQSVTINIVM